MLDWIMSELEKEPTSHFYLKDLEARDITAFNKLKAEKLLTFVPLDEKSESFGRELKEPLTIENIGGTMYGIDEQDPDADPRPLTLQDMTRYKFALDRFSSMLREANKLTGTQGPLDKRLYVIGNGDIYGKKIACVLGFLDSDKMAQNLLLSLRSQLSPDTDLIAVVTPHFIIESEVIRAQLARLGIYRVSIADTETLKIDMADLYHGLSISPGQVLLSQEEKDEAARQGYRLELPVYIAGTEEKWNTTLVIVNGCRVPLGDGPFILFLRMFVHLREKPGGSLTKAGLVTGGYLKRSRQEQIISDLRKAFDRATQGRGAELIESSGRGMIRLSIHPHLIKYNTEALKRHRLEKVRRLAERLS